MKNINKNRKKDLPIIKIGDDSSGLIQAMADDGFVGESIDGHHSDDVISCVCVEYQSGHRVNGDTIRNSFWK